MCCGCDVLMDRRACEGGLKGVRRGPKGVRRGSKECPKNVLRVRCVDGSKSASCFPSGLGFGSTR
eukprot:1191618-Prorocentrum_minimum.AAC.1